MTTKDYQLIAKIFNKNITSVHPMVADKKFTAVHINKAMAQQFADVLAKRDPSFNKSSFIKDCGLDY